MDEPSSAVCERLWRAMMQAARDERGVGGLLPDLTRARVVVPSRKTAVIEV